MLFQLWDECEEPRNELDDRPEAKAGQRVRGHIIRFVRERLPAGSPEAFGLEELRRLNASRSSTKSFAPYAQ